MAYANYRIHAEQDPNGTVRPRLLFSMFDGAWFGGLAMNEIFTASGQLHLFHTSVFVEIDDRLPQHVEHVWADRSRRYGGPPHQRLAGDAWDLFRRNCPILHLTQTLPQDSFLLIIAGPMPATHTCIRPKRCPWSLRGGHSAFLVRPCCGRLYHKAEAGSIRALH